MRGNLKVLVEKHKERTAKDLEIVLEKRLKVWYYESLFKENNVLIGGAHDI